MTRTGIEQLLQRGEGIDIEFKESFHELNKNAFETVCAFLNRKGGHLLLGVTDSGKVEGVLDSEAERLQMELINNANNPQKLQPVFPLSPQIIGIDGKQIIYVYVPESSMVHSTVGKIFDRNGDADQDITRQQAAVTQLHLRKQQTFTENRIYPHLHFTDLRPDLIDRARRLARSQRPDHPWLELSDEELLRSAGLYQRDYQTGQEGYTLAAALLFGKDEVIQSILPYYKSDALYRVQNVDRYDDRDDVRTNLIEAYDRLMAFIAKHLPDKFFQEPDMQRVSIRDKIFREVVANILIHREYANPFPAKLIIEQNQVRTENGNKPYTHGALKPETVAPHPKNPVLTRFFKEIGRMDELGSGVRNLFKYVPHYAAGKLPELEEEDIFRIMIPVESTIMHLALHDTLTLPDEILGGNPQFEGTIEGTIEGMIEGTIEGLSAPIRKKLVRVLSILFTEEGLKANEIAGISGFGQKSTERYIKILRDAGFMEFRGAKSTGGYYLTSQSKGS